MEGIFRQQLNVQAPGVTDRNLLFALPHVLSAARVIMHDQTLFHALPLHRTPRRVQPTMNLFLTRLPTSNPSSFLPVDRKDVNNYKLTTNEKEENMKTLIAICMMLALMAGSGCQSTKVSGQGGIVPVNEEFNITVPASNTVKQIGRA